MQLTHTHSHTHTHTHTHSQHTPFSSHTYTRRHLLKTPKIEQINEIFSTKDQQLAHTHLTHTFSLTHIHKRTRTQDPRLKKKNNKITNVGDSAAKIGLRKRCTENKWFLNSSIFPWFCLSLAACIGLTRLLSCL